MLKIPVWAKIPNEEKVAIAAANQGDPLVLSFTRSKICKAIIQIADQIDGKGRLGVDDMKKVYKERKGFRKNEWISRVEKSKINGVR